MTKKMAKKMTSTEAADLALKHICKKSFTTLEDDLTWVVGETSSKPLPSTPIHPLKVNNFSAQHQKSSQKYSNFKGSHKKLQEMWEGHLCLHHSKWFLHNHFTRWWLCSQFHAHALYKNPRNKTKRKKKLEWGVRIYSNPINYHYHKKVL